MNRPQQVRAIFQELRQQLGDRYSARELLEQAASLVDLFTIKDDPSRFELRTGSVPFEEWSLDRAMADGGWRILNYECRRNRALFEEEAFERRLHHGMARLAAWGNP